MAEVDADVIVVGAGLAGLACARHLLAAGLQVQVMEADDGVGGRARTDRVDGFRLDRGFQVLCTGYPELTRLVPADRLDLRAFDRAMLIRLHGHTYRLDDPRRRPAALVDAARIPLGSVRDRAALAAYVAAMAALPTHTLKSRPDRPARDEWHRWGMSDTVIDRVLAPLLRGVTLDADLTTSSRFVNLMVRMFVTSRAAVPAAGMQALADQLAVGVDVQLHTPARAVAGTRVDTDGRRLAARAVVVATDGDSAADLVPGLHPQRWNGVTTYYHVADSAPMTSTTLLVDADRSVVDNSIVLTNAAPSYSPDHRALIASSVVHRGGHQPPSEPIVRAALASLYGTDARTWAGLATYTIGHALPAMSAPHPLQRTTRTGGVFLAGDYRATSSVQGALVSGRHAAEAVLAEFRA